MTLEWYEYLLLILGGGIAGIINTLAGNGSLITLSLLMFFGLPSTIANGTNRIGILFQSIIAIQAFAKSERFKPLMKESWWIIALAVPGGIAGAFFAGHMADIYGRRTLLIIASLFFLVSAWGSGVASSSIEFVIYRVLGGLAVGAASVMAPAYISEIAPAE